jgi:hypothetical protein
METILKKLLSGFDRFHWPLNEHSMANATFIAHVKLLSLVLLSVAVLSTLADVPYAAILVLDIFFCAYIVNLFKTKYKYIFFLHPLILFASSQLFTDSFLNAGDGEAYGGVIASYLNTKYLSFNFSLLSDNYSILEFFKYTSLGVVPTYAIPEFFFGNPVEAVYYLWQGTFHVFLCALVFTLAHTWRVLDGKYLFSMALFAVVSPTFFEVGTAPTRHFVTFFGVVLLFISHLAVVQRFTLSRVMVVLISRAPLLLPYVIFFAIDMYYIRRIKLDARLAMLVGFLMLGVLLMGDYFYDIFFAYDETSKTGAATFSGLTQWPIIGGGIKYVYALLAPFPWSKAPHFIATTYAGNGLLFFMHILSALTGLYLFFVVILKHRVILDADTALKQMVAFGLIMSMSILKGSTGFHFYLSIYFPMLAPLLAIRRLQISPLIPIGFVIFLEGFFMFAT